MISLCLCLPAQEFENLKESPSEGVYIYGLYLDGCAWSGRENKLVDSEPKKLYHPLPVLYVTGVQAKVRLRQDRKPRVGGVGPPTPAAVLALCNALVWSCVSPSGG